MSLSPLLTVRMDPVITIRHSLLPSLVPFSSLCHCFGEQCVAREHLKVERGCRAGQYRAWSTRPHPPAAGSSPKHRLTPCPHHPEYEDLLLSSRRVSGRMRERERHARCERRQQDQRLVLASSRRPGQVTFAKAALDCCFVGGKAGPGEEFDGAERHAPSPTDGPPPVHAQAGIDGQGRGNVIS